ncbi:MAG: hypothetical protein CME74_08030 [Halomonas sp.]|jgi:deoxyribodipyrimidine photolyase-like uncharacterized protein|nr:hypothetical protein [Halomonas sp.]
MSKPLLLVLGDQLTLTLPTLCDAPSNAVVALCEVAEEARYVPHHLHKTGRIIRGDGLSAWTPAGPCMRCWATGGW